MDSRAARRHLRMVVDGLLAAGCAVTTAGPAMDSTLFGGSPYLPWRPPSAVLIALATLAAAAALLRRRRPLVLVAVALTGWTLAAAYPVVVLAQFTVGAQVRSRRTVALVTVTVVLAVAVPFRRQGLDALIPVSVALCLTPVLLGLWVSSRRAVLNGLRERAEQAERDRVLLAEQVRAEERAHIAHDMHDVVTHRVSLMVLHATAAEVAGEPERRALVRRIRSIGRDALDELRGLVGVLRADDAGAPLVPQPVLADVPVLAEQSGSAGTPVTVTVTGSRRELPAMIEHTGYRVVQEALTNVHKHGGADAAVRLLYDPDRLTITVTNSAPRPAPPGSSVSGHGLIGLRERLRFVGGRLDVEPTTDGGFRVTAVIPVPRRGL